MPQMATPRHRNSRRRHGANLPLIALRINAGLSRDMLAARAGVGRETIRLAESGFVPTPRIQFAISSALERTPLDLWPIEHQRRPK